MCNLCVAFDLHHKQKEMSSSSNIIPAASALMTEVKSLELAIAPTVSDDDSKQNTSKDDDDDDKVSTCTSNHKRRSNGSSNNSPLPPVAIHMDIINLIAVMPFQFLEKDVLIRIYLILTHARTTMMINRRRMEN